MKYSIAGLLLLSSVCSWSANTVDLDSQLFTKKDRDMIAKYLTTDHLVQTRFKNGQEQVAQRFKYLLELEQKKSKLFLKKVRLSLIKWPEEKELVRKLYLEINKIEKMRKK